MPQGNLLLLHLSTFPCLTPGKECQQVSKERTQPDLPLRNSVFEGCAPPQRSLSRVEALLITPDSAPAPVCRQPSHQQLPLASPRGSLKDMSAPRQVWMPGHCLLGLTESPRAPCPWLIDISQGFWGLALPLT